MGCRVICTLNNSEWNKCLENGFAVTHLFVAVERMWLMSSYVSPWMDDELSVLRDAVRQFFAEEFSPHEADWKAQGMVDREAWLKAGEMGILCPSMPEAYGGVGGTFAHETVISEELCRAGVSSFGSGIHSIVAHYILALCCEEQKKRWLGQMVAGEKIGAIAMTEPGAGSDLQGVMTTARRDGDSYIINGSKTFITNGYLSDLIIVVAKTDKEKGSKGISLFMLEAEGLDGFSRGNPLKKIGMNGCDTTELFFDNVRIPADNLLGEEEGLGFVQLMQQLPFERLLLAVSAVACMEVAIEETVKHVKERKAFGKTLMEFQNTRFKLAECETEARIARVFLDHCIDSLMNEKLDATTASMAKWWCSQKQCEIVDECLQLFGGYGYMMEYPIANMYVDSRVQKIYGGTNEIMKEMIARTL
jgi:acyl-CoA dehydrogenase